MINDREGRRIHEKCPKREGLPFAGCNVNVVPFLNAIQSSIEYITLGDEDTRLHKKKVVHLHGVSIGETKNGIQGRNFICTVNVYHVAVFNLNGFCKKGIAILGYSLLIINLIILAHAQST